MIWNAVLAHSIDDVLPLLRNAGHRQEADALSLFHADAHARIAVLSERLRDWARRVNATIDGMTPEQLGSLGVLPGDTGDALCRARIPVLPMSHVYRPTSHTPRPVSPPYFLGGA